MDIKYIIFDLDDVLIPFKSFLNDANELVYNNYIKPKNIKKEIFYQAYDFALKKLSKEPYSLSNVNDEEIFIELLLFINLDKKLAINMNNDLRQYILDNLTIDNDQIKYLRLLRKRGIILGVLTNSLYAREKLNKVNLLDSFDFIISPNETGTIKPDIVMYEYLFKMYRLSPSNTVFVGDSYKTDLEVVKKLGFKVILFSKEITSCILSNKVDLVISKLEDIDKLIL
ncbi:MAG: HAD family hydrolase [DPANN group archaeon]|nr:HAD family hydrolase [DPANN group archaeon]